MKKISVIVSVFKVDVDFFIAAIKSIREQTYTNWEMIIINDGDKNNDDSYREYMKLLNDERIKYVCNDFNSGISKCLNQALEMCTGEFIAKMDSDDISLPSRFEEQLSYFVKHPECNVLGTYAMEFGNSNNLLIDFNNYSKKMRNVLLLFRNAGLIHPSVMIRKSFLDEHNIKYDEDYKKALDYRLWVTCSKFTKINCINKILLLYRRHDTQISTSGKSDQDRFRDIIRTTQLEDLVGELDEKNLEVFLNFCDRKLKYEDMDQMKKLLELIEVSNKRKQIYNKFILSGILKSECLTSVMKNMFNQDLYLNLLLLTKFLSVSSISMLIYNKFIDLSNKFKKKYYLLFKKSKIKYYLKYKEYLSSI